MPENIPAQFLASAVQNSDEVAFRYFDQSWKTVTYSEFLSLSKGISAQIRQLGVVQGERIAIISENRPEWCAAYMAILFCRCIAVPVDTQLGATEIRNILSDSGAKLVFHSSKTSAAVLKAVEDYHADCISFDSLKVSILAAGEPALGADPDEIASIIYTSGTTGSPKGVMLTHRNFCSDASALVQLGLVVRNDNVLSILPMHHTYPFMCTFLVPVFLGGCITFSPGLKTGELLSAIRDGGVTVVVGVPRLFERIRNGIIAKMKEKKIISRLLIGLLRGCRAFRRGLDVNPGKIIFRAVHKNFRKVKFFACGGARLDPDVMNDLEALGFTVLEGYGLTETSPVITFNPAEKRKPGSAGKALPGAEIRIVDEEIVVRGPMVMAGYYRNEKATTEAIREGWFYTGDIGNLDRDGYLFITGRKKEVIVLSTGKNIYPEDVEKAYLEIPLIKEIGITGVERNGIVESIQAIIVPDLEYAETRKISNITETLKWELNEVASRLPEYMRVHGFSLYAGLLPRTSLGKLRRFMLRDILTAWAASDKEGKAADSSLMKDEIGRKVVSCIKLVMRDDTPVGGKDNLELDIGFDSLKRIEFISSLEEAFSISLPETFITEVRSVEDVVARLKEYAEGRGPQKGGIITWKDIIEKELPAGDLQHAGLIHGPVETALIHALIAAMKIFFKLYFRMSAGGLQNVPAQGPYIIASNHSSYLDGFTVAAAIPFAAFRDLYFLGFSKFFTGGIKQLFARISHVIPIDAEVYLNRALQMSSYVLRQGKSLCIFPEGGRSFDKDVLPFKKGVGIIAIEKSIPVIPVYIDGSRRALPRGAFFVRPAKIKVTFGKPFTIDDIDIEGELPIIDKYQFFADKLRERVIGLSKVS
ncbi:MAG TPA: AMP-binding protein [Dissulfurispiraceae bacterium]|nr:AMP-binding protein [Dissulfurispiraceae bacterium]